MTKSVNSGAALERRRFLGSLAGAAALAMPIPSPEAGAPAPPLPTFRPDVDISLRAVAKSVSVLTGTATECWMFDAQVLAGDAAAVKPLASASYLGPTLTFRRGQKVRIRFTSDIAQPTVVHWHGLHVPATMDGHPRFAIPRGQTLVYEFEVRNRAGTYWYHAHPDTATGPQVYRGLAGSLIVTEPEEDRLDLPRGQDDVSLVLQDRAFDRDNQLVYSANGAARMMGFLGDRILVNGRPDFTLNVPAHAHRLRILNGSNARIYRLAWSDASPLVIIGTDGGLIEKPARRSDVLLGPGERVELWADFGRLPVGSQVKLVSQRFDAGSTMPMMRAAASRLPQGSAFAVASFTVGLKGTHALPIPERLRPLEPLTGTPARTRAVDLRMQGMQWTLNGRTFEMLGVSPDEKVRLGTLETWEFRNQGGGMGGMGGMGIGMGGMMQMPHPMHIHGGQFRIVSRTGPGTELHFDEGWQDTTLVMAGQSVKVAVRFDDYAGIFLYHCHNLEHEDQGMMRNYAVEA